MANVQEIWKDIPEYEGLYQVSNLGRVKSLEKTYFVGLGGVVKKKESILKFSYSNGYQSVAFHHKGNTRRRSVHRIVFETFNGKTKLQVDHINGVKDDNRLCNLQALSCRDNVSKHYKGLKKTSIYTGVCWNKKGKTWQAGINVKNKNIYLGSFKTELEAHNAYQKSLKSIYLSHLSIQESKLLSVIR